MGHDGFAEAYIQKRSILELFKRKRMPMTPGNRQLGDC